LLLIPSAASVAKNYRQQPEEDSANHEQIDGHDPDGVIRG
jgi:hypothetical protein